MPQIKITLVLDIPDGTRVGIPDVDYADSVPPEPPYLMAPLPIEAEAAQIVAQTFPKAPLGTAPSCPQHGLMTRWPAGVSKRTQKPYGASWRCNIADCPTKPIWDAAA